MEQQSGPCGWSKMGPTPTPGKLRLWTYQSVANGADTVVYFAGEHVRLEQKSSGMVF